MTTLPPTSAPTYLAICRRFSGAVVAAVGGAILLAGLLSRGPLPPWLAPFSAEPTSALCFLLIGLAIILWRDAARNSRRAVCAQVLGGLVVTIGTLALAGELPGGRVPFLAGRITADAALCFSVIGLALVFLESRSPHGRRPAERLAFGAGLLGFAGLVRIIYEGHNPPVADGLKGMPLTSALMVLVSCSGILAARSDRGWMAHFASREPEGMIARRLLPGGVVVLFLLGWIIDIGERRGWYGHSQAPVLLVTGGALMFGLLVQRSMRALAALEARRRKTMVDLHRSERLSRRRLAELQAVYATAPVGLCFFDTDLRYVSVNQTLAEMNGRTVVEHIGRTVPEVVPGLASAMVPSCEHVLATGQPLAGLELRIATPDRADEPRDWLLSYHPVRDSYGMMLGVNTVIVEITERKAAERELRRSEERFRLLVEGVKDYAVFMLDTKGRVASWNEGAERIFGYQASETAGRDFSIFFPEEDIARGRHQSALMAADRDGRFQEEAKRVRKDGSHFWSSVSLTPIRDEMGQTCGFASVVRDISERKRSEIELAQSRQRLDGIIASAMDAIVSVDEQHRIVLFNPAAEGMFGIPASSILGQPHEKLIPPRFRSRHGVHVHEFGESATTSRRMGSLGTVCGIRANGEEFSIEASISQIEIEGERLFTAIMRDATERERFDQALRESEERARLLIEQAMDGVLVASEEGIFTEINDAACRMLGYDRDELLGRSIGDLLDSQDRGALATVAIRLRQGETESGEWVLIRKDGLPITAEVRGRVLRDGRFVVFARDVTERKQAESVRRARDAAEAANRAKDQFLAMLSHELRTPLAPVLIAARMLSDDEQVPGETRELAAMMYRNVALQAQLVDDLLDQTRITRGILHLHLGPVDMHEKLQHVMEMCAGEVALKQIQVETMCGAQFSTMSGDGARLQQVLWNLLKNAVKFSPIGGRVGIYTSNPTPEIFRLELSDSGAGIAPEVLPRIFDAFEQGGVEITRQFGGLGLGLAISRAIVEMHGGTLAASSAGKGRGATFMIEFPVAAFGTESPIIPRRRGMLPLSEGISILLVEDHVDTANILIRLLERRGHRVRLAQTVTAALELAETETFRLLISDIGLPDGNGCDLMRQLLARRRVGAGVALSGYGMEEDLARSRDAGFSRHLVKPIDPASLDEAIRQTLSREDIVVVEGLPIITN